MTDNELNKSFQEIIPTSTANHAFQFLNEHLYTKLKDNEIHVLKQLIDEYPILNRVLIYTYSSPEDYKVRMDMLKLWHEADLARNDYKNPQIQQDVFFCRRLQGLPEVANCPTLKDFLNGLYEDFSLVTKNDIDRGLSEKGLIREPQDNFNTVYEDEDQKIITINQLPFYRIEHCINKKTSQIEIHYHLLKDDVDLNEFFTDTDAYLTEWLQWFPKERQSGKPAKLFIHGPDGELIQPPSNHIFRDQLNRNQNYIPFDLPTKYMPLILKKGSKQAKSTKNLCGNSIFKKDLDASSPNKEDPYKGFRETCQEDAFFAFLENVVPEWKGNISPAAHFQNYLHWRIADRLKKKENKDNRQPEKLKFKTLGIREVQIKKDEDPDSPELEDPINSIQDPNPINLPEEQNEWQETYGMLNQIISELKEKSKPLESIILDRLPEINDKEISTRDIQKEYFNKTGEQATARAIQLSIQRAKEKIKHKFNYLKKD